MLSSTRKRGSAPRSRRIGRDRPLLERLEERCLFDAGGLDLAFGAEGLVLTDVGDTVDQASLVAVQEDYKILVAGVRAPAMPGPYMYPNLEQPLALVRYNRDGSLDTSFDEDGIVLTEMNGTGAPTDLVVQPDGKILLAANRGDFGSSVLRYNRDGSLDTSFDEDGIASVPSGYYYYGSGGKLFVQEDGKFLLARNSSSGLQLVQYNPDGSLDTSFDDDGIAIAAPPENYMYHQQFEFQPDGKIVAAASAGSGRLTLVRYNPDGSMDDTFGEAGIAVSSIAQANPNDLVVAPDGKILVSQADTLIRFDAEGMLDPSFDGDGVVAITADSAGPLAVQPDGKILVASTETADFSLIRYNVAGSVDSEFAEEGQALTDMGGIESVADVLVQPDGQILIVGSSNGDFALVRHLGVPLPEVVALSTADGIATFDPATGIWYRRNQANAGATDFEPVEYGLPGWHPLVGDWDGNGSTTIGVVDPSGFADPDNLVWHLSNEIGAAPDIESFAYGLRSWSPVVGDWDADGAASVGVVDTTGMASPFAVWHLRNSNTAGAPDVTLEFGLPGWIPVAGDWNGDGIVTPGMFDPSSGTWYLRQDNNPLDPTVTTFAYGGAGWTPVVGDWDGDGIDTIGVVDPSGVWYLRNSNDAGAPDIEPFPYGIGMPLAGNWDAPTTGQVPLTVADGPLMGIPAVDPLASEDLAAIFTAALQRLRDAGVDPVLIDQLARTELQLTDLPGAALSVSDPENQIIRVDAHGAGHGYYLDPAPEGDEEFQATEDSPLDTVVAERPDLLTVMAHELANLSSAEGEFELLDNVLPRGVRRLNALDEVFS